MYILSACDISILISIFGQKQHYYLVCCIHMGLCDQLHLCMCNYVHYSKYHLFHLPSQKFPKKCSCIYAAFFALGCCECYWVHSRLSATPISLLIHVCPSELQGLQGLIDRCMCRKVWSIIKLPLLHVNWWCCTHTERPSNEFPGTLVSEENLTRNVTIAIYSLLYLCYYN